VIRALAHVSVLVPSYAAGLGFFCDVLGMEVRQDVLQPGKRWLVVAPKGANTGFVLARAADAEQTAAIGQQGAGRVWLFLQTDDFDVDLARLSHLGVSFEEIPRNEPYGKVAVFRDPFGNRWDLIEYSD
jgi:catechol 2,3-dioxygenase-like lactoylglutathione lyase family enzyme